MRISIKYYVLSIMGVFVLAYSLLHTTNYQLPTAYAGNTCITNTRVEKGLISATDITGFGNSEGQCVVGNKAAFVPYKIPSYNDLKSLYYAQAKPPTTTGAIVGSPNQGQFTPVFTSNDVILVNGNLPDLNYAGTPKPTVVFVEGTLSIDKDITYGNGASDSGLVFVVQGNVNIASSVTRIDAVIISSGTIRTAGPSCTTSSEEVATRADALTINGSLISLDPDPNNKILFCRTLAGNLNDDYPAEVIINQPKYLVILRNLFADTVQKWSEIQ